MKKIITILLSVFVNFSVFALPGFTSYIQDRAGEFVYYKDSSFQRESYIGLLCYDKQNYQIRYYAPANKNESEKIVASLFSVNPDAENFEMTGENVIIADYTSEEDVTIINYLHDLLYDFSKKRIFLDDLTPFTEDYKNNVSLEENGLKTSTELDQFGGNVYITYDCIIPFFNIKYIEDTKGKKLFECVEIGQIKNTNDQTFDRFKKIPETGNIKVNSSKPKKHTSKVVSVENQKITLDDLWEQKLDYMWAMKDDAIISLSNIMMPSSDQYYLTYFLIRSLLESKEDYIINFNDCDVVFGKDYFKVYSENYSPSSEKTYYGIKIITNNEDSYDFCSFAATRSVYLTKRSYFDAIIKSYRN